MRSCQRRSMVERAAAVMEDQEGKAAAASAMAVWVSSALRFGTEMSFSLVAGSSTGKVSPEAAPSQRPLT